MCGIAGLVTRDRTPERSVVKAMIASLRHRGPDAEGLHVHGNVALGHRRLSVIDTSAEANQPMFNEDGTVGVVFNGEIYNFAELRASLSQAGHNFRTRSDTEVLVHAWEEYGEECVLHLRGMFAFAIHDTRQRRLFLARDRLGKKPLYYLAGTGTFAFASEIKALRCVPGLGSDLDLVALGEYAAFGNTLGSRSIWQAIRRLPPGHTLQVDLSGAELRPRVAPYWSVRPEPDWTRSEEEWIEALDATLADAVRLRMVSDVPLGAFLSGGIDSSLVVAYMARMGSAPVNTFTMRFEEASHDESTYAAAVARHLGTHHHEEVVTQDELPGLIDRLVDVYDEPFADESAIPTYYLSQMTRRQVTVALSGDGGDESFGGYDRYRYSLWLERAGRLLGPWGRGLMGGSGRLLPESAKAKRLLDRLAQPGFGVYLHAMGLSDSHLALLHPQVLETIRPGIAAKMLGDVRALSPARSLDRYMYSDLTGYLPDDVLVKVDRASMAHSLEVRCPLLDQEVVELAARIPPALKVGMFKGKRILRQLLSRYVPDELVDRPKMGFGVPISRWLLKGGPLLRMLEDAIADGGSPMWQYYDRGAVERRLRAHQVGGADLHVGLWRALFFHRWCDLRLRGGGQS